MKEIKNIAENIKTKIEKGELKMKPKAYFVIGNVLAILGVTVFAIISTFSVNMIVHFTRVGRLAEKIDPLPFSLKLRAFFIVFPWEFLLISIGFILLGVWLIRKFENGYKTSITVLFTLFAVIVLLTAIIIDVSGFNERAKKFHMMRKIYDHRREVPNFQIPTMPHEQGIKGIMNKRMQENFNNPKFERNF